MKLTTTTTIALLFLVSCTGSRPTSLGIKEGKLTACPKTPNCISSFSETNDAEHFRSPVAYKKPLPEAFAILKKKITDYERTNIIQEGGNYIYVEFTSLIMRYVDDVEFYFDEKNKLLHFRSASRLGKSDLGVNRKRIERILTGLDI
ncbi:DUF1499 domain-containing protein [Leptospira ilyithenensis]|uniref:DUF1499 domain-containing protein n=1 Tax=Leptospira ilyithenensis TaxID=2484901 RepID=A0A4R9LSQ9_9LEPT|nr:DUF1499 domain-containing protein [Leptospira ilyithenensis]TGN10063.1 DUF1499 domain-containing protein [Leptospira ilyithenensis]